MNRLCQNYKYLVDGNRCSKIDIAFVYYNISQVTEKYKFEEINIHE